MFVSNRRSPKTPTRLALAPCSANAKATAAPIPVAFVSVQHNKLHLQVDSDVPVGLLEPVTIAVLPLRDIVVDFLCFLYDLDQWT